MEIDEENRIKKFLNEIKNNPNYQNSIDKSDSRQISSESSEPLRVSETILEEDEPIESENVKIN